MPYVTKLIGPTYSQGEGRPGLGGVVMDLPSSKVTLAWKGSLPAEVKTLVANPPAGVRVAVVPAKFTRTQLKAAAETLVHSNIAKATGVQWSQIGLNPSGAGLDIQGYPVAGSNATLESVKQQYVKKAGGVDVSLSPGSKPESLVAHETSPQTSGLVGGRWIGAGPPWIGGEVIQQIRGKDSYYCSTSFIGTYAGADAVTTAYHCGGSDWWGGELQPVGSIVDGILHHGTEILQFRTSGTGAGVYGGDWTGNMSYPVAALGVTINGLYTCSGGAASGTHCNVVVRNDWTYYDPPEGEVFPAAWVQQIDGQLWANAGDSGGPVFSFTGQGGLVAAVGVVEAGDFNQAIPSSCGSLSPAIAPKCTVYGWFVQSTQIVHDYPYTLKVVQ